MRKKAFLFLAISLILSAVVYSFASEAWKQKEYLYLSDKDWDVCVIFDIAHKNTIYPFSEKPGEVGKYYFATLSQTDNNYQEYTGRDCCTKNNDILMGQDYPSIFEKEKARRAKGWYVERKKISDSKYIIQIRGLAWSDCDYENEGPGYVKGMLAVDKQRGWKITEILKNSVQSSDKGQETYFKRNDLKNGEKSITEEIHFASGSNCGGCCACSDSAGLDIEVVLERGK